jgi:hypothetical protein
VVHGARTGARRPTPQEAAADLTRRDEVSRLIASFPHIDPASGVVGLRPDRLSELLGLSTMP